MDGWTNISMKGWQEGYIYGKLINGLISRLTYGQINILADRKTDGQDGQRTSGRT